MRIEQAALAGAGMRLGSDRARGFAVALEGAADAVPAAPGARAGSYGAWAWYAVDLALGPLPASEVAALAVDLGLAPSASTDGGNAADGSGRGILRSLLRDRLVDLLRLAADQPAYPPRAARFGPGPGTRLESAAAA